MNLALPAIASPKALNASRSINHPLLTSEERVALAAQLHLYLLLGRAKREGIATRAGRLRIGIISRMNVFFHDITHVLQALACVDADLPSIIGGRFVFNDTINEGKEGIVPANANIIAGMNPRTALSNQYRPGTDILSGVALDTKPLPLAITTVLGAATTLLMRHLRFPLSCDEFSSWQASRVQSPVPLSHR